MKKITFLFLCATILIASCKKSGSSGSGPAIDATQYYAGAIRTFNPGALYLDSFEYNSNHLISRYIQYTFDSTGSSPFIDSLIFVFSFSGNSAVPASYTFSDPANGLIGEGHQLFYDGQNRVVKDSILNGSLYVTTYSYPGNNIASVVNYYFFGSVYRKDTLVITNGNITSERIYSPNSSGTADSLNGTINFTPSSYGNPVYHPQIANTIGHLLFNLSYDGSRNYGDFNSKDLARTATQVTPGSPNISASYTMTLDSKGRISLVTTSIYPAAYYRILFSYID